MSSLTQRGPRPGNEVEMGEGPNSLPSEDYVPRTMPRILRPIDMIALYIMAVFWVSNVTGIVMAGPAAFTFLLICAVGFFIPCAIVTAQLGVMLPHEGSIYNWTYHAFWGRNERFWSFFIGLCAWLPGVLSLVSAADVVVNCLQTLNPNWLGPAWQQGVVIIFITLFCGVLSLQRARTVQNIINVTAGVVGLVVLLIGVAGAVWLLTGHHSATDFTDPQGWAIHLTLDPNTTNLPILGTVTLALLGATMPLNMGGEIALNKERASITSHLLWGTLLVLAGYFVLTFAVLAVGGQTAAFSAANPIVLLVTVVQTALGPLTSKVVMIGIMLFYIVVGVFESSISARLLMVAAIDRQIPIAAARLNKNRIPMNAVIFQTCLAVFYTAIIFFAFPTIAIFGANPDVLTTQAYTVTAASLLLIWAFSFMFPFIDAAILYRRNRVAFNRHLILPLPLLMISMIVGPIVCLGAIGATLLSSWIPQLIPNNQWWILIACVTFCLLVFAILLSLFGSGQATWETFEEMDRRAS
ncbi:MAG: APC family permease [Ktedonobacteraceae bacterium]